MTQSLRPILGLILAVSLGFQLMPTPASGKPVSTTSPKKPRQLSEDERLNKIGPERAVKCLKDASVLEFYVLNPMINPFPEEPAEPTLFDWTILGRTTVTGDESAKLIATLRDGLLSDNARSTNCSFSPRHALKIQTPDGTRHVIICFQCGEILLPEPNNPKKGIMTVLNGGGDIFRSIAKKYHLPTSDLIPKPHYKAL